MSDEAEELEERSLGEHLAALGEHLEAFTADPEGPRADAHAWWLAVGLGLAELEGQLAGFDLSVETIDGALGVRVPDWRVRVAGAWSDRVRRYLAELGAAEAEDTLPAERWIERRTALEAGFRGLSNMDDPAAPDPAIAALGELAAQLEAADPALEALLERLEAR
ncbi:MAG: hypothetical protein ACYS26_20210 [Planctomycetota bacterium]